jgi:hypothetical protein
MGKGKRSAVAAIAVACIGTTGADAAAQQARVEYRDVFTTQQPGAPSGRMLRNDYFHASDPAAKSPALKHLRIELPTGARFDTGAVPPCRAGDAEIIATRGAACPKDSALGTEVYIVDTGFPEPNRFVTVDIQFFNEPGGIIVFTEDRSAGSRLVNHGKVTARTYDLDYPPLPGTPPEGGTNRSEDATFAAATGPGGAYLTTPPSCPAEGFWTFRATFTYVNGEEHLRESRSPCAAGATVQRLTFFRRQRARADRPGRLRLRAAAAGPAQIEIERGGRRVRRGEVRLRAGLNRVALPALPAGAYELTITSNGVRRRAALAVSKGGRR